MREIAPNIYVSTEYPDVNLGLVVVPSGGIAVDAPTLPEDARAWRRRVVETIGGPILYTVLTDAHPHRLLSAWLLKAPIVASRAAYERATECTAGFWRNVVRRLARRYPEKAGDPADVYVVLPEILFSGSLTLHTGGLEVTVRRAAGGAPGSAWVDLRERGVLFVGDTLVVERHPVLDAALDTKVWLDTLTTLRRPRFSKITLVPGRGPLCDQSATRPLSEYIRLARRRVRSLHRAGRPEEDVAEFVPELLSFFPVPDGERVWLERRVESGLERVYEELQP